MAGKVGDARWFDEEVQSQGRSKNEDQNKTDCSTHAGACGCVCCSCAATIAYGSRHRFDVRRYAHGQGQDSCPVHADVCEGRHEVRTGRGEKGLHLGRTRSGTRQARWPESHGQGNSEGWHALRSGSRRVEIASSFDSTLESVPPFRLFSRRTTYAFETIGPSNGRKHRHVAALRASWTLALPQRTAGNYREYPPTSPQRVELIQRALTIGFSLSELKAILAVRDNGGAPCRRVR